MSPLSRKLVLCIDDDDALLRMLKTTLEVLGYVVLTSCNGAEALQVARHNLVDAVIVDYAMPDGNGAELAVSLKCACPGTPILMFSASGPFVEEMWGVDGFVCKTEGTAVLASVLERLLDSGGSGLPIARKVPRYPLAFPLVVSVQRSNTTCVLHGVSIDMGEGGVGGCLDGELVPGELVSVQIFHPDLQSFQPRAQVRHQAGRTCGLQFLDLNPAQRDALRQSLLAAAYA